MLTFSVFNDSQSRASESVHVDPLRVAAVHETNRRPMDAFAQPVAIISLTTGERFTVYDYSRSVGRQIAEAKAAAAALGCQPAA